jgi:hypothetical protein
MPIKFSYEIVMRSIKSKEFDKYLEYLKLASSSHPNEDVDRYDIVYVYTH